MRDEVIAGIAPRLIEYFRPERICLFGFSSRGDEGPDTDLDSCVVLPDDAPETLYRPSVRRALWGAGPAAGLVRQPANSIRAARGAALLPATVLREGRLLV